MAEAIPYLKEIGVAIVEAAVTAAVDYAVASALGRNKIPEPEAAKQPQKQPIPPKQTAFGEGRISGPYLYWDTVGGLAFDIIALAKGPVASIDSFYLNDDAVTLVGNVVQRGADGRYQREGSESDTIRIESRLGDTPSPAYLIAVAGSSGRWTEAHRADGVATMMVVCRGVKADIVQTIYPNGPVQGSAVGHWSRVYDWRQDSTAEGGSGPQRRSDPSTWTWSENPVLCLVHDEWCNRGHDFDYRFGPTLAQATIAANVCDEPVPLKAGGTAPRYTVFGMYQSNNPPKDLRSRFLSTFDGMMIERGDGAFVILAGAYTEPTVILDEDRIKQFRWRRIRRTEDRCNSLSLSYNSPEHGYTMVETQPWDDPVSVAAIGEFVVGVALPWVTRNSQARRIGKAAFSRLNCEYDGYVVIDLSEDELELEQRYYRVRNRRAPASMWDVVVEVRAMTIDLVNRLVRLEVIKADPSAYYWDAATEEGDGPNVPPAPIRNAIPAPVVLDAYIDFSAGAARLFIMIEDPERDEYGYVIQWRSDSGSSIQERVDPLMESGSLILTSSAVPLDQDIYFRVAFVSGAGSLGTFSDEEFVSSEEPSG